MSPLRNKVLTVSLAAVAAITTLSLLEDPAGNHVGAQSRLADGLPSVVFVSRGIPRIGSVFWDVPNDMPGVGPCSRFRVAAPGRLSVLESYRSLPVLVDGGNPRVPQGPAQSQPTNPRRPLRPVAQRLLEV